MTIRRKRRPTHNFGETVRSLRTAANATQATIAAAVGIKRPYLAHLETRALPSPELAARLGEALGASPYVRLRLVLLALDEKAPRAARLIREAVAEPRNSSRSILGGRKAEKEDQRQLVFEMAYDTLWNHEQWQPASDGTTIEAQRSFIAHVVRTVNASLLPGMNQGALRRLIWDTMLQLADENGMPWPGGG